MQMPDQGKFVDGIEAILAGNISDDGKSSGSGQKPWNAYQTGEVVDQARRGDFDE